MKQEFIKEETLSHEETFIAVYKYGLKKARTKKLGTFLSGIMSGIFIGFAYIAALYVTRAWSGLPIGLKNLTFGIFFSLAISMIIFLGGDMFTSSSLMTIGVLKKEIKISRMIGNLLIVLAGNFVGCFFMAALTYLSGYFDNKDFLENALQLWLHKADLIWWQVFFSGILCNFLVAGSVYASLATKSSTAKFLLSSLIITVFATCGFSHVVANSYVWFLGLFLQINDNTATMAQFWKFLYNIQIPTLFGNFVSGGILLPGIYYLIHRRALIRPRIIIKDHKKIKH